MSLISLIDRHERPRWAMAALRQIRAATGRCPCERGMSNCYGGEFGPCPYCACPRCKGEAKHDL